VQRRCSIAFVARSWIFIYGS